jgi:hypothetical protein
MPRKKFLSDQGRYTVSLPPGMRERIKQEADLNHRTMNAEVVYRLHQSLERQERNKNLQDK